jgi:hypothetical protein
VTDQYLEKIEWDITYRPGKNNLQSLFFSNTKKYLCVHGNYEKNIKISQIIVNNRKAC